jgi:hypothetical protein
VKVYESIGQTFALTPALDRPLIALQCSAMTPDQRQQPAQGAQGTQGPDWLAIAFKLHSQGQLDEAIHLYRQCEQAGLEHAALFYALGLALQQQGHAGEALGYYERASALDPNHADAFMNAGVALATLGARDEAIARYDRAIAANPALAVAHFNRGLAHQESARPQLACQDYEQALAIDPNQPSWWYNLGAAQDQAGDPQAAMQSYRRAVGLRPNYPEAYCNAGVVLRGLGRYSQSVLWLDAAIRLKPDYAEAYSNRALALKDDGLIDEAVASFDRAITLKDDYANAYLNKAFSLLLYDRYAEAWPLYEWRFRSSQAFKSAHSYRQAPWSGQVPLEGKTLLIHSEQGLGDNLQGLRFIGQALDAAQAVYLTLPQTLVSLAAGISPRLVVMAEEALQAEGSASALAHGSDFRCPIMSLPLAFNTTLDNLPHPGGYLKASAERIAHWQARLTQAAGMAGQRKRVGLVWRGKALPDPHRSIDPRLLSQHLPEGPLYVSLQQVHSDADRAVLGARGDVVMLGEALESFEDTAALASCLDLSLCIDTSVAHLLGALGLPAWLMLRRQADWRWGRERTHSPWYESLRLYRQRRHNDWASVLPQIEEDLRHWLSL